MPLGDLTLSEEIERYNAVRQRLRKIARDHPELLDVHIARGDRLCQRCKKGPVRERPGDEFHCTACGYNWKTARL